MPRPWYLVRGCEEAWRGNRAWCRIAKWEYGWAIMAAYVLFRLLEVETKSADLWLGYST